MSAPISAPMSLHEAAVEHFRARDQTGAIVPDPELSALENAMATGRQLAEQVAALHAALEADETRSPQSRAVELRSAALRLGDRAAQTLDGARSKASAVAERIAAETAAPPPPRDPAALGLQGEIRATLARAGKDQRAAILKAALDAGDDLTLRAVLTAPAYLAGLEPPEHENLRHRYRQSRHPEAATHLDRLSKALEATERGGRALVEFVGRLADTPEARAAELKAQAAGEALEAARAAQ